MKLAMRGAAVAALMVSALWGGLLAGCASTGTGPAAGGGRETRSEMRTESDQSGVERRARTRLELASAYLSRGQAATALDEIKQALIVMPDLPDAYALRGLIYASLNDPLLAEQNFQRALQLAPRDGGVLHNHAWFLCQQRRFDDADKEFAAALGVPQYAGMAQTWLARGVCAK
ncbi:MAG: hypothetical protein LBE81_05205, partial [Azonexus sp.]|nr:hypothetical protein [Azonexus sp.]